jgi:acyl CoA:acetate/3-ketoacid CoA transferase beta subunit
MQTFVEQYSAAFSGEIRVPVSSLVPMQMSERKIIARRAALELKANSVVNLGIGMPEGVSQVATEEKVIDLLTLTAEPGVVGGIPASGLNFGAAVNTQAIIDQPYQFDFYDGGGLDLAFLGLAQADREGNLNVSKFGPRLAGAGGFINISQSAKSVVFVGTFTAGNLQVVVEEGKLKLLNDIGPKKFVAAVEHRTFAGAEAVKRRQPVLYVTERCVFRLGPGRNGTDRGPGVDIERDILARMDFSRSFAASRPDGRRDIPARADGAARAHAHGPALAAAVLRRREQYPLPQLRASVGAKQRGCQGDRGGAQAALGRDRAQGLRHRQLRSLRYRAGGRRRIRGDGQGPRRQLLLRSQPLHDLGIPACEAGQGAGGAGCCAAHLRVGDRGDPAHPRQLRPPRAATAQVRRIRFEES